MPGIPFSSIPAAPALLPPTAAPALPVIPAHWRFPAAPASVRRARHAIAEVLPCTFRPELADDLGVLTSELVTNAIRHGTRPDHDEVIELVLWPADGHYWLAVSDPGAGLPSPASPGPESCGGRGLLLVDALSSAWGVVPRRTRGKSVIAGVPLHGG